MKLMMLAIFFPGFLGVLKKFLTTTIFEVFFLIFVLNHNLNLYRKWSEAQLRLCLFSFKF